MKTIDPKSLGLRVFVYYNLHRHCWSVKALEGREKGRVLGHAKSVTLVQATAKVSQKGRQRVLREQKKNVHAGIVGTLAAFDLPLVSTSAVRPITYNPYRFTNFVDKDTLEPFGGSPWAHLSDTRQVFVPMN